MSKMRLVPDTATEEQTLAGMAAKVGASAEIDGPITPLPVDREPTLNEMAEYSMKLASRIIGNEEISATYSAMLSAAPNGGRVSREKFNKMVQIISTTRYFSAETRADEILEVLGLEVEEAK